MYHYRYTGEAVIIYAKCLHVFQQKLCLSSFHDVISQCPAWIYSKLKNDHAIVIMAWVWMRIFPSSAGDMCSRGPYSKSCGCLIASVLSRWQEAEKKPNGLPFPRLFMDEPFTGPFLKLVFNSSTKITFFIPSLL